MEQRVMVVDDNRMCAGLIKDFLLLMGLEVDSAVSGEEALSRIGSCRPQLLFLDVHLPGMDGIKTLEKIREAFPSLPVIMTTAASEEPAARKAVALGASDYLLKPFGLAALERIVKKHL